jgi:xanthine/CO dehydrogenase XdhC/CoxF family maturation factor
MVGAISGGCVEKEIWAQAQTVFKTGLAKIITYDGRFRIGCEGLLHILIEPFHPTPAFLKEFDTCISLRKNFNLQTFYSLQTGESKGLGSVFKLESTFALQNQSGNAEQSITQEYAACFRLLIAGNEYDAVVLANIAAQCGWEIEVVLPLDALPNPQFSRKVVFHRIAAAGWRELAIDGQTAVVLMSHNYAKDLNYLIHLSHLNPIYIGVLGSVKRNEQLLDALIEQQMDIPENFFSLVHGPAGLNIKAITPQEIAISIVAEIVETTRKSNVSKDLMHMEKASIQSE